MQKIIVRILLGLTLVLIALALGLYIFNPSGAGTLDPRARILGFVPYRIPASSMSPTLLPGDFIIASTYVYVSREPGHQEVITFKFPPNPSQTYVKRVIGVPGDNVKVVGRQVLVNDKELEESYTQYRENSRRATDLKSWEVPDGHYFVMGDNRDNSADSRSWGFVPRDHIVGRVEYVWMSESDNTGPLNYHE